MANAALPLLWRSRILDAPDLDVDRLVQRACAETGLEDFGDPWFFRPLRRLAAAIDEEADLNPVGRSVARIHLLKLLKERLRAEQWFNAFPEIRARRLGPPLVIVGPMRSGTTRLHRLLAADLRFAHLRMFETMCPVPPMPNHGEMAGEDGRARFAARSLRLLHAANPATAVVHPTGPYEPEEELGLLVVSAWGMKHEVQWHVPSYARWCERENPLPAYCMMADLLRLIAWHRGDPEGRPWVLKSPQYMLDLPALLAVFPDARLIFLHRDPAAIVGSSCSMVWNQMLVQSESADRRWIGREWLRKTGLMLDRVQAARSVVSHSRAIDVHFEHMNRDWRSELGRIYDFLGLDIAPAEPAMAAWLARCERHGAYRTHCYDLGWFGLDARTVREQLGSDGTNRPAPGRRQERPDRPNLLDGVPHPLFERPKRAAARIR
jgi:hypothetical protein